MMLLPHVDWKNGSGHFLDHSGLRSREQVDFLEDRLLVRSGALYLPWLFAFEDWSNSGRIERFSLFLFLAGAFPELMNTFGKQNALIMLLATYLLKFTL